MASSSHARGRSGGPALDAAGGPGPVGRTARRAWTARGLLGVRLAVARVAPRPTGPARPHGPGRGGPRGDGGDHVRQWDPVGEARLEVPDLEPLPGPPGGRPRRAAYSAARFTARSNSSSRGEVTARG